MINALISIFSAPQHHAGKRCLVVDDDMFNREIAADLIDSVGLKTVTASDGREAVALVQAQPFDLVLMDVHMPVMDGLQASRTIRLLPGCASLPIVALTANAFVEDRQACFDAGMNAFVPKPVVAKSLYDSILPLLQIPRP
jgi:two-component system sensor histidine kinase/response regulator